MHGAGVEPRVVAGTRLHVCSVWAHVRYRGAQGSVRPGGLCATRCLARAAPVRQRPPLFVLLTASTPDHRGHMRGGGGGGWEEIAGTAGRTILSAPPPRRELLPTRSPASLTDASRSTLPHIQYCISMSLTHMSMRERERWRERKTILGNNVHVLDTCPMSFSCKTPQPFNVWSSFQYRSTDQ